MKRITQDELNEFLRKHKLWLVNDPTGERANLYGVDLREANLYGADLREAKNLQILIACPEEGSFIAFKKANNYIVKLLVPEDAKRCSATSRKCRCNKAVVLSITNCDGSETTITSVCSSYDSSFVYTIGEVVEVTDFKEDRFIECAPGIHFFITRQEAVNY